jgi:hypothetical protein
LQINEQTISRSSTIREGGLHRGLTQFAEPANFFGGTQFSNQQWRTTLDGCGAALHHPVFAATESLLAARYQQLK